MSTPGDLLAVLNDLAKRVAERQLAETDALANLKHALQKYPQVREQWTEERATAELDKRVKRHRDRGNKAADAAIARKLAELGMERPTLDGDVVPSSDYDAGYKRTLGDREDEVSTHLAGAWRLINSFERQQEENEILKAAADGNAGLTGEQAVGALARLPEAKRQKLIMEVKANLAAERRAYAEQRYGGGFGHASEQRYDFGHASEG